MSDIPGDCKCGHELNDHCFPDGGMEPCAHCDCETYEESDDS